MKNKMEYIDHIAKILGEAGMESMCFYDGPVFRKDGIKYEIIMITAPDKGDTSLHIRVKRCYQWFTTKNFQMDESWPKATWAKITRSIESEIKKSNS